jgi:alkanesulfonate monooxygenase SsuD/methylene tetrahydromethanopterin reductase-like flavin-dependent oxidoreductase (luciferase family)
MKIGLLLANQYPIGELMERRIDEVAEQVDLMRTLGFDLVVLGQHHLAAPFQQPSSVPLLASLAAHSGDMRLGITVFLLPLHNPVDIAEQVATLDAISHGRMIFGVGLGYRAEEYAAFGTRQADRVPRFVESLEIIKQLWTQDEVEYTGRFYSVPRVRSTIRCVQTPYPPIWIAANQTRAVERAGRLGHAWVMNPHATVELLGEQVGLYRTALRTHGHPALTEVPLMREAWIAETRAQAWEEAGPFLAQKYAVYTDWGQDRAMPAEQTFVRSSFEDLARDRFIIGTPEDLVAEAQRCASLLGADTLILRVQWPGMPQSSVLRQIRLLGEHVVPRLAA